MSVEIVHTETVHEGWTKLSVVQVRLPSGKVLRREVEDHGQAVVVLPYDPVRKLALLVRQFRAPVYLTSGESSLLEPIAGIVEEDDAAEAARREAVEEAGLHLGALEHIGRYWSSPGLSTERMEFFIAPYTEADRRSAGGGIDEEEITVVELPLAELAAMAERGALADVKLFALVQTLRLRRPDLFRV
jgi:nudix-type nucleoside diphosphatase (YffH/AdpP family)